VQMPPTFFAGFRPLFRLEGDWFWGIPSEA
jgi:hypothetical protein